jgi:hypothetical protein
VTRAGSTRRQILAAAILVAIALAIVLLTRSSSPARGAARPVESLLQDDDHLLYAPTATVAHTLAVLKRLGVERVRVTILWRAIAPASPPAGFDAADPAAYPATSWFPYDRLVELAQAQGIGVDFDLTAPGPLWAMARGAPRRRFADHWAPSAQAFGQFVAAVGRRYSGSYRPGQASASATSASGPPGAGRGRALPRVSFWSVWNEPNQPGWLAPQWQTVSGRPEMESPVLYRSYVDSAWSALLRTGHGPARDEILVGELAPEGSEGPDLDFRSPIPPMSFLRALYCVDQDYRPLRGAAAAPLGCPQQGGASFVSANPGLFNASGFAHHPYSFFLAPSVPMPDANFVPLADLGRLERGLDAIFAAYRVRRHLPLWLTEYGYETDPPNTCRGIGLRRQSLYLNEAQYLALRDPRVKGMSQFLLYDSPPDPAFPPSARCAYWSTFQTGLEFADGLAKPSLASYRLPLFLPDPVLGPRRRVLVWAMLRPAPPDSRQLVELQWRPADGAYRTLERIAVQNPQEVLVARPALPGPGVVRVAWRARSGGMIYSRGAGVTG